MDAVCLGRGINALYVPDEGKFGVIAVRVVDPKAQTPIGYIEYSYFGDVRYALHSFDGTSVGTSVMPARFYIAEKVAQAALPNLPSAHYKFS